MLAAYLWSRLGSLIGASAGLLQGPADDRTVCTPHSPSPESSLGLGKDLVWTPKLPGKASFALIKVDPVPDGG